MNTSVKTFLLISSMLLIASCTPTVDKIPEGLVAPENPLSSCPDTPNCFRTTQYFEADSSLVFTALHTTIKEMNAHEVELISTDTVQSINAIYKIPVFGWMDDVNIIIESNRQNISGSFVHLRSASREGYSDLGVNKRRINRIIKDSRKKLNAQ